MRHDAAAVAIDQRDVRGGAVLAGRRSWSAAACAWTMAKRFLREVESRRCASATPGTFRPSRRRSPSKRTCRSAQVPDPTTTIEPADRHCRGMVTTDGGAAGGSPGAAAARGIAAVEIRSSRVDPCASTWIDGWPARWRRGASTCGWSRSIRRCARRLRGDGSAFMQSRRRRWRHGGGRSASALRWALRAAKRWRLRAATPAWRRSSPRLVDRRGRSPCSPATRSGGCCSA